MGSSAMLNKGAIAFPPASMAASNKPPQRRTLIVSGIARSGTSMVAAVLREAGIYLGEVIYDVVHEDARIVQQFSSGNLAGLPDLIRTRNAQKEIWGFKIPNLHSLLPVRDLRLFRGPHLIVIYRDPVAIAVRERLSEHVDEARGLLTASIAQTSMIEYVARAGCPTLSLSYEKALLFPNEFVDTLLTFCGIECDSAQRQRILRQVEPNKPSYLEQANTAYVGKIEGILDGRLYGWCHKSGWLQPVHLEVYADEALMGTISANRFRPDLADAGIGNGNHGFFFDLGDVVKVPDCLMRVRVRDTVFDLEKSNKDIASFTIGVS